MRFVIVPALLLVTAASGLRAQKQSFLIRRGADTVAVENFTRDGGILTGEVIQKNGVRFEYVGILRADSSVEHVDLTRKGPASTTTVSADLTAKGAEVTFGQAGAMEKASLESPIRPVPFLLVSMALSEQIIKAARLQPGQSVKWLALRLGAADTATATITRFHVDSVSIVMGEVGVRLRVNAKNDVIGGTNIAQPWVVERKP